MATRVTIYENVITAHFSPGGVVYRNGSGLGRRAQAAARGFVNNRTGNLSRTITHGIRPNFPARLHTQVNLKASASYAMFVNDGTVGPITPRRSPYMKIPAYGQFAAFRATEVSGQRAQRYLQRGMNVGLTSSGYGAAF